jgi:hypothetical protein
MGRGNFSSPHYWAVVVASVEEKSVDVEVDEALSVGMIEGAAAD